MPDAESQPRPPGDGAGRNAARGGTKRTSAELETIVLSILRASPRPLGAYVIARKSRSLGAPMAPNQVYRVLERLRGRVRRVETLNAYFEDTGDEPAIAICRCCGRAQTFQVELGDRVARLGRDVGFRASRTIIEVYGKCSDCV